METLRKDVSGPPTGALCLGRMIVCCEWLFRHSESGTEVQKEAMVVNRKVVGPVLLVLLGLVLAACGGGGPKAPPAYNVAGVIKDVAEVPVKGVSLSLIGSGIQNKTVTTNAQGKWEATDLRGEVTVTPAHDDYKFDPTHLTVTAAATNVNFTATLPVAPDPDPDPKPEPDPDPKPDPEPKPDPGNGNGLSCDAISTGAGTPDSPHAIHNVDELQAIADNVNAHYVLCADIDSSATKTWNSGAGFEPIVSFAGTLDGRMFEIIGLHIDRPNEDRVGLFGSVDRNGVVRNVRIVAGEIRGKGDVGALVGYNEGQIDDVVNGASVQGADRVGGVIGRSWYGNVSKLHNSGPVVGGKHVGGVVGFIQEASITDAVNDAPVTGRRDVGGIVGGMVRPLIGVEMFLRDAHNSGDVTATSADGIGDGNNAVGGIAGSVSYVEIENVSNGGTISGYVSVGGIVGHVTTTHDNRPMTITHARNDGIVEGFYAIGGIVGDIQHRGPRVFHSHNTASVRGDFGVGGIVGSNAGVIQYAYNTGDVAATDVGENFVGGVAGTNYNQVEFSFNLGSVEGYGEIVGGLVGQNGTGGFDAILKNSYNLGPVAGSDKVGGAVGHNRYNRDSGITGRVERVYNAGGVEADVDAVYVGGLIGLADSAIVNRKATVVNSYWDMETSGQDFDPDTADPDKIGTGKTTGQMKQGATFVGWGIGSSSVWTTEGDTMYPDLLQNPRP